MRKWLKKTDAHVRDVILATIVDKYLSTNDIDYDTLFWREVFIKTFGEEPMNSDDPRWDKLFNHRGLGGLNAFQVVKRWLRMKTRKKKRAA